MADLIDSTNNAVEVNHLRIEYGSVAAVLDASFTARFGEVTVLLGPNGAGKTSTIEHLEGFKPRSAGTATVLGLDPMRDHSKLTEHVGIMLQEGGVPTAARPLEIFQLYSNFFDNALSPGDLIDQLDLGAVAKSPFSRLSGGEKQRVSLGLAIIGQPRVLFLDEPTAGVDIGGKDIVYELIASFKDRGVAVILTTHDLGEAERLADQVSIIVQGCTVMNGSLNDLARAHGEPGGRFETAQPVDTLQLEQLTGVPVREVQPRSYAFGQPLTGQVLAELTQHLSTLGVEMTSYRSSNDDLESIYRAVIDSASTQVDSISPSGRR